MANADDGAKAHFKAGLESDNVSMHDWVTPIDEECLGANLEGDRSWSISIECFPQHLMNEWQKRLVNSSWWLQQNLGAGRSPYWTPVLWVIFDFDSSFFDFGRDLVQERKSVEDFVGGHYRAKRIGEEKTDGVCESSEGSHGILSINGHYREWELRWVQLHLSSLKKRLRCRGFERFARTGAQISPFSVTWARGWVIAWMTFLILTNTVSIVTYTTSLTGLGNIHSSTIVTISSRYSFCSFTLAPCLPNFVWRSCTLSCIIISCTDKDSCHLGTIR